MICMYGPIPGCGEDVHVGVRVACHQWMCVGVYICMCIYIYIYI